MSNGVFLLLGLIGVLGAGCAHASPRLDPLLSLGPAFPWETNRFFQKALQSEPGRLEFEKARIDYLLERVSKSPYNFIRNQSRYTGIRGWIHLRWKYFRNRGRVKTAEDFINYVATSSKTTGEPYLIEFPDKRRHPLRTLLVRELEVFDHALAKERKRLIEASKEARLE